MNVEPDPLPQALADAFAVTTDDVEASRVRAATEARVLGGTAAPVRVGRFFVIERIGSGAMGVVYAAFDPELERKVAVKLLAHRGDPAHERERVAAEGRAMAKLAHPNVVHVYEVGEHAGRMFVAMEYVRGRTLHRWLETEQRSVPERLAACVQAGRGLAAAHAAGLMHRDFKPDNIMVGDDGRVRVLDFGLSTPSTSPTGTERVHGTPGYIAPELLRGVPASTSSDQFSLCVTIWEALTGQLPFGGATPDARIAAVLDGRIPASVPRPPAWIERILRRGLEGERYPDVDALLKALTGDPAPIRRRRVVRASMAAVVVAAFVGGNTLRGDEPIEPCSGGGTVLDDTWAPLDRTHALARIAEGGTYGAAVSLRIGESLDDFVGEWAAAHRDACLAHARGEQSAELLDRRMWCLDRGRGALAGFRGVLETAEPRELAALALAAEGLPRPDDCGDLVRLEEQRESPPPHARELAAKVDEANVLFSAGRSPSVRESMPVLVDEARALGYRPLLAELLYLQGLLAIEAGKKPDAAAPLREATVVALACGRETLALLAWSNRAWAHVTGTETDPDALEGEEMMRALLERYDHRREVLGVYTNLGSIALTQGKRDEARRVLQHGAEIGARLVGEPGRGLVMLKQNLALTIDDPRERRALQDEVVTSWTTFAGAEHPRTIRARIVRAESDLDDRRALGEVVDALAIARAMHPAGLPTEVLGELTMLYLADWLGEAALATEAAQRLARRGGDEVSSVLGQSYDALWSDDAPRAASIASSALDDMTNEPDEPWFVQLERGQLELVLGRAWQATADARAAAMLRASIEHFERASASTNAAIVRVRLAIGRRELARAGG